MDTTSSQALTARAIEGDPDAIRLLWQQHRRWVAAILLAHKPRQAELDDLLQEVAMTLVSRIKTLRSDKALKPWLRTIAINAARAQGRKASRRHRLASIPHDDPAQPADPAETLSEHEDARRVYDRVRQLPESYREPLLLRCLQGMSYRQIGAVLDLPETTIETRIARGRRMLRDLLAQQPAAPMGVSHQDPSNEVLP